MHLYKFSMMPPNLAEVMFPLVRQHLQRVVDLGDGEVTYDSLLQQAINNEIALLLVSKSESIVAACVFEERTFFTGKKCLYIPIMGGDKMDEWGEEFHSICVNLAKTLGCTELRGCAARTGWVRKLKSRGLQWREVYSTIAFDIPQEESQ